MSLVIAAVAGYLFGSLSGARIIGRLRAPGADLSAHGLSGFLDEVGHLPVAATAATPKTPIAASQRVSLMGILLRSIALLVA